MSSKFGIVKSTVFPLVVQFPDDWDGFSSLSGDLWICPQDNNESVYVSIINVEIDIYRDSDRKWRIQSKGDFGYNYQTPYLNDYDNPSQIHYYAKNTDPAYAKLICFYNLTYVKK